MSDFPINFAITILIFFVVAYSLHKALRRFRHIPRVKIAGTASIAASITVSVALTIFRPFASEEVITKENRERRETMRRVIAASEKEHCLKAKDLSAEVRESVANELQVHPTSVTLGRTSFEDKCLAVLYVPRGTYTCSSKTTIKDGLITECTGGLVH